ncbi:MAG: histidine phosphatase family protein [Anaerolineales bacterium]|jgi:broad specificity phosphatase PhoE
MTLLLLIRHAENDYSKRGRLAGRLPGVHLNERGKEQAKDLGKALRGAPIKALYSSPLDRALETAKPIARELHLSIQREAGLVETDVGQWQGRSIRRLALTKAWRVFQQAPSRARHPGGESMVETQARVVSALEGICTRHKPRDMVACVLHSDPIKLAVAHFIGLPLDHMQRLSCDTASTTLLAVGPYGARLLWLNRPPPLDFGSPSKKG